jgi:type I restriction enzyme S subunit
MGAKPYPAYKDSGVEWIGDIPEHWEIVQLRNVITRRRSEPLADDKVVTAFRDGQVTQRELRRSQGYTESDKEIGYQHVEQGDLVIHGMDAFAGAMGIAEASGKCSPVCLVCIPKPSVNTYFLGLSVRNVGLSGYIWSLAKGIRERSCEFRWPDARLLPLAFPPLEEQKLIASFLDRETGKIDTLVEHQQQLISLLKEKRQSLISHTVTKGLNPNVRMKDSGVEWIGEIPEHWDKSTFQRLADYHNGYPFKPGDMDESGKPITRISHLNGKPQTDFFRGMVDQKHHIQYGDLLFSWSATLDSFIWNGPDAFLNQHIYKVVSRLDTCQQYLYYLLKFSTPYLADIEAHGSTMTHIKKSALSKCVFCPPLEEQKQIAAFLDTETSKIDQLIDKANQSIALLKERRSSLISAAVTGKIDVREAA